MKKILVSIAILGGLVATSPVLAQRANPGPRAEYRYDNHDRGHERAKKHPRHHAENRHRGPGERHWSDDRQGPRKHKTKHGRKQGHCRKAAPPRAPRRGHHRG